MPAHLLQSTLFAAAVWLTTLALRHNHARTRHALWMAASVKFLAPFSLLVTLGGHLVRTEAAPVPPPQMRFVMSDGATPVPYAVATMPVAPHARRRDWLPLAVWPIWSSGCAAILLRWYVRWRAAAARLRESTGWNAAAASQLPLPVRCSACFLEPGVFGIFRPTLVLPAGIEERLSAAQLQAVFEHELCHVRHRDNLAAAIHMLVEALFWFHPLVWWMGTRLVEERERACDEEVLHLGSDRAVYAESILRVCQFSLESPAPCVSGITGADLKSRIRDIMTARVGRRLEPGKKLLLATLGVAAVVAPLAIGLTHPKKMHAQAATAAPLRFDVASVKLSQQQFSVLTPHRSGGHITWITDLWYLLGYAYRLEPWRISGPVPGREFTYLVDAETDPNATNDQVRLMFQTLLTERFRMAIHRATRDTDGYALTVAKSGLKMEAVKDEDPPAAVPEWFRKQSVSATDIEGLVAATIEGAGFGTITGRRVTMVQFSEGLQRVLRVPVIDQTGAAGKYYFALRFQPEEHPGDSELPDLLTAVQSLGLKLEKHRGPVEMLIVDRMNKTPTEN